MARRSAPVLALAALATFVFFAAAPARSALTPTSATIAWTSPGDDSLTGTAAQYDVRIATSPITSANFASATALTGAPAPLVGGTPQTMAIGGLTPSTAYWVAIKTADEMGNWSGLSNVITFVTPAQLDAVRPARPVVTVTGTGSSSVTIAWTATGDDSLTGTADHYEVRWARSPINPTNWLAATLVGAGVPAPAAPGTAQGMTVTGLDLATDLYLAVRVYDEVGNASAVGSAPVVPGNLDASPPATPASLSAAWEASGVRVRWAANGEADLAGYRVYRADVANGTFTLVGTPGAAATDFLDASAPDSASLWYQLSAVDASSNESARSGAIRVWRDGAPAAAVRLQPAYPNPSSLTASVALPIDVPANGATDGRLDILDGAGQRLRSIPLRGLSPGTATVSWDGRNESGRLSAPGVYRAVLHLGGATQVVQFVRKP